MNVTLWARLGKDGWVHNHLEDGHCASDVPTPQHPSHAAAWKGGQWKKEFVSLQDGVIVKPPKGYAEGDPCPECGEPMLLDEGYEQTRDEPELLPAVFCEHCGMEYPVDWARTKGE